MDPGPLIARGRAADVFDAGPGRVLRRYRPGEGGDVGPEAAMMEHARRHGYPVPAVHEARDRDLVLERVDGPTMLTDLGRRPWRVVAHGRLLAELHRRLHEIPAPAGAPCPFARGDRLIHMDLHPDNVLLTRRGPMVIDWSNASAGESADDVAVTWAIMATSEVDGSRVLRVAARHAREVFVDAFLSRVDRAAAEARLPEVAARRLRTDPHLRESERRALEALRNPCTPGL